MEIMKDQWFAVRTQLRCNQRLSSVWSSTVARNEWMRAIQATVMANVSEKCARQRFVNGRKTISDHQQPLPRCESIYHWPLGDAQKTCSDSSKTAFTHRRDWSHFSTAISSFLGNFFSCNEMQLSWRVNVVAALWISFLSLAGNAHTMNTIQNYFLKCVRRPMTALPTRNRTCSMHYTTVESSDRHRPRASRKPVATSTETFRQA